MFAGARIRRLRRQLGLTQKQMAERLAISTSYLHLIERNQRPLTVQLLIRLATCYDIDVGGLTGGEEAATLAALKEVFSDPIFEDSGVGTQDISDVVASSSSLAQAVVRLYHAYRDTITRATEIAAHVTDHEFQAEPENVRFPIDETRDFLHMQQNHFPELETVAENFWRQVVTAFESDCTLDLVLRRHLAETYGTTVEIATVDSMGVSLRRFDPNSRRLQLSEMLTPSARTFALAYQLGLVAHSSLLDQRIERSGLRHPGTRRLLRIALANYFAAAVMMPYQRFVESAEALRYDIETIGHRFGASYEQVCHRLTTLQRPGQRGIPFFMLRLDHAGNISKCYSAGGFSFARLGGTCPRWNVHEAFATPGKILTQLVQMPDRSTFFSISRTVESSGGSFRRPQPPLAIALGCPLEDATRLIYAEGWDLRTSAQVTPIGINCRLCERQDCLQRVMPPLNRPLQVDENHRVVAPFSFAIK